MMTATSGRFESKSLKVAFHPYSGGQVGPLPFNFLYSYWAHNNRNLQAQTRYRHLGETGSPVHEPIGDRKQ